MKLLVGLAAMFAVSLLGVSAGEAPYAGQDLRSVSSLSDGEITDLLAGAGSGLAKPAELNGWPGPRHVLDLADDLDLTAEQVAQIEAIFSSMNTKAKALGADLVAREREIDLAFESGEVDGQLLGVLVAQAEAARADLRLAHLEAHIETKPLLTRHQNMTYQRLRGYGGPVGHQGHN